MQRQDQSFGQLRTSLSPDYLNFENDLLVNELKSTVKNKMNQERIDRVAISGKLDHEKYLRPDGGKMNNYFESKVGLNNIYDRDMKTVSPALVRGEMNEVLKPLKRRRRKKDKYFRGYDTGDSRSMSDANAFAHRSKMNGHRNTIRDKRHVDGSEVDLVETTEVETTDYEKRGFDQHRLRSSSALNSRHRHKPRGTSLVETIGDSEGEMGLLSSAAGRYQSDKEPNFLKIFGEERSGQASRVRSGSGAEEVHYLEEDLTRAERKIESLKQEVSRLQLKNSDLSHSLAYHKRKKNAVSTDPNSVLVEGQSRDVDLELRNLRLMQELKNEEVESKVANRVADIIEQVHGEQKKRDDALLKQVREARSEREQLIKQVEALKKQVQFLQKPKGEQLTDVIGDDSQPSIDRLLEQIENASSGFDIEKAGAVLLDRVMKTKETVAHIRDEELQHVVAERNQATEKLKDMELYFFSVDKFSSSTPKDRQINTAPIVPSDDRVNRALKTELQQAARARDEALKHSDVLQQELNAIKDYLGKSGPPGEALLEDLGEKFSRGQDPVVSHLERLTQDLSDKLKLSENARVENEKSLKANEAKSAQLTKRNEERR
ncbi:uncharacterized protein LOC142337856 isoform X2 [Convolutriloba macropyga]|uniref:uncharacterized protein LOC142337856 isoform X2 n=1 Tax=Convolutriloba macropyga TaxID=536237 RepID=UPI003F526394